MTLDAAAVLWVSGVFATVLGVLHFFFPVLFDFETAMPREGASLKPFRLLAFSYRTLRSDVRGLVWVMNHFVSVNLVAYGIADLFWPLWLRTPAGPPLCLWMAAGWLTRAASQLYMGRRFGDLLILGGFAAIGIVHVVAAALLLTSAARL